MCGDSYVLDKGILVGVQLFDPEFVEYDEHLTPPTTPVKPYLERLTEDDVRNNPPSVITSLVSAS